MFIMLSIRITAKSMEKCLKTETNYTKIQAIFQLSKLILAFNAHYAITLINYLCNGRTRIPLLRDGRRNFWPDDAPWSFYTVNRA